MGIAPSRANLEGVRAKQGRKNEGPSSALLQRYITLLTHFGDPATDLDSFAGPPERSSATLKWSVAEEPIRSAATAVTLAAGTDSRQLQAELLTCFVIRVDPCSSVANICSLGFAFARAKRFGHR